MEQSSKWNAPGRCQVLGPSAQGLAQACKRDKKRSQRCVGRGEPCISTEAVEIRCWIQTPSKCQSPRLVSMVHSHPL